MTDMQDESSAGASPWERELYAHLSAHVQMENDLLENYSAVAENTESKALRYLVELLVEEETKHHRLFSQLADSLKSEALFSSDEPDIPYLDFDRADSQATREATEELINKEEEDLRELKRLRHELRDVKDTSLWDLLIEVMEQDTQKHLSILRFVARHNS
jgi:rubrerythrin